MFSVDRETRGAHKHDKTVQIRMNRNGPGNIWATGTDGLTR